MSTKFLAAALAVAFTVTAFTDDAEARGRRCRHHHHHHAGHHGYYDGGYAHHGYYNQGHYAYGGYNANGGYGDQTFYTGQQENYSEMAPGADDRFYSYEPGQDFSQPAGNYDSGFIGYGDSGNYNSGYDDGNFSSQRTYLLPKSDSRKYDPRF